MKATPRSLGSRLPRLTDPRRLFAASFLMLFAELALIRYSASYVVYLAYFTNFILLASFLGIGVGFLRSRRQGDRFPLAPVAMALLVGFVLLFPVQAWGGESGKSLQGWFGLPALPIWALLPVLFLGVTATMALIAEGVARVFVRFSPLEAYRLDILGSLAGIVAFSSLSFLDARPLVWGLVIAGVFLLVLAPHVTRRQVVALSALVLMLGLASVSPFDKWSPYYRITVGEASAGGQTAIRVNGLPHQSIVPVSALRIQQPYYFDPYTHIGQNPLDNVLVIGAGTGNDVAVALSEGAKHVDAVEIDPVLQAIGRDRHPDHPYENPRVTVHIDDGRAFLQRSDTKYNLVVLALPDSLTLVSGQGSLRLESYLFTEEAIAEARDHLAPGGAFTMYNYYRPFVFERFASTLTKVYGHAPCFDASPKVIGPRQQAVLTISRDASDISCSTPWQPTSTAPAPATDDHPFPYLPSRSIPIFYAVTLALILAASLIIVRVTSGPIGQMRPFVDLFFMGVAFLLLETKNVVQFALLFGTTWFVNALVFAGILLSVYLAVEVVKHVRVPRPSILYSLLFAALAVAWAVNPDSLLSLPPVWRFVLAAVVAFAPVFLANLVFAQRFKDVGPSSLAFGANLLGAMVGGVLEYTAMVVGYRNLLILVALMYGLALVTGRRHLSGSSEEALKVSA